jgi:alanine transaminase
MEWPELERLAPGAFPGDVIARARELRAEIGSIGAYPHPQGVPFIRKNVARFISSTSIFNNNNNNNNSNDYTRARRLPL